MQGSRWSIPFRSRTLCSIRTASLWFRIGRCMTVCPLLWALSSSGLLAQNPQDQVPAFSEPKFRDKVWEAGGPMFRDTKSGKLILSVTIQGEKTISEHSILSKMQSRPDRLYDSDTLNRDINELYRTNWFDRIETRFMDLPEGVHIKLIVHEKPIVSSVVFHGNKRLDEGKLQKHAGIEKGDAHSPQAVLQAKQRLIDLYRDEGMNSADIQVYQGAKIGETDVIFRISEGEVERLWSIEFVGNNAFSTSLLKARIRSKDAMHGVRGYISNIADLDKLAHDREILESYYRSLGYFDARVDYSYRYDDTGKWMFVTFVINEGEQYTVNEITIRGNKYYSAEQLTKGFKLYSGMPFNQGKMAHDARLLRDIYGATGFYFCDIGPVPVYLPDHKVNLIYEIEEGDIYRVSDIRVHIDGQNSYTKHTVPMNLLGRIRPNRILDSREVDAALTRIKYSEIFNKDPSQGELPQIVVQPYGDEFEDEPLP